MSRSQPVRRRALCRLAQGVLALALAHFAADPAFAQAASQDPATAPQIEAVAYAPIPEGASFETQVNGDSELNQDALDRVDAELKSLGYGVGGAEAGLVMQVETTLVRGQRQDDPLGRAFANNDEAQVEARLFSSTQNSLLNPQQPIGSSDRLFRINLSVYDRSTGIYVWRGSASRSDPDIDVGQASNAMIAELVRALGQTVTPAPPPAE